MGLGIANKYYYVDYYLSPCCTKKFYEKDFIKSGDPEVNYYDYIYCCGKKYKRIDMSCFREMRKENNNENIIFWLLVALAFVNCIAYIFTKDMMFFNIDGGLCLLALFYKMVWLFIDLKHC
jgi:hypothetical protein